MEAICAAAKSSGTYFEAHREFKQCVRLSAFSASRYLNNSVVAPSGPGALLVFKDHIAALISYVEKSVIFMFRLA